MKIVNLAHSLDSRTSSFKFRVKSGRVTSLQSLISFSAAALYLV